MSYSSFTNLDLKREFGVQQIFRNKLFPQIPHRVASDFLKTYLEQNLGFALAQGTEKARSEWIIAPILSELRQQANAKISIFSGINFDVEIEKGLSGFCDYLISRSPYQSALEVPVVIAVEAKRDDFERGITQCAAEMIAANIYNHRYEQNIERIYGCVTTGDFWRFMVFRENTVEVDTTSFEVSQNLEQILGLLWAMSFDEIQLAEKLS